MPFCAVRPLLLLFPLLQNTPNACFFRFRLLCSCFICSRTATKKGHPEKLLKLSEVSPFCHRVDWNGFLERMFFSTDIIARFFHGAKPLSAVLCCPSSAYAPECSYLRQNPAPVPSKCFQSTFTPYSTEKRSMRLKMPFWLNWVIFFPISKT